MTDPSPTRPPEPVALEAAPDDLATLASETSRLEQDAAGLDDAALRQPSLCDGWTRAHVLAHVAGNARAIGNLVRTAEGTPTPMYASRAARDADIETGAGRPRDELLSDVRDSARTLATALDGLPARATTDVTTPAGLVRPDQVATLRLREVVYHHVDLDTGYTFADAPTDLVRRLLADQVDRLTRHPDCPPLSLRTDERDRFSVGDGSITVSAPRAAMLAWLARGDTSGIEAPSPRSLPALPALEAPAP